MRYVPSPEFTSKLSSMDAEDLSDLLSFTALIEKSTREQLLEERALKVKLLGDDVYLANLGDVQVYFSIGGDGDGEYLLLLDFTAHRTKPRGGGSYFAAKDPRTNSSLNPRLNSSINPRLNSSLNPRLNSSINPRLNSSLNPRLNSSINPKFNSGINLRFNSSINPRFNTSLNPRFNSSLNPRLNQSFGGPFLYDLNLNQTGYLVRANGTVDLIFSLSLELVGTLVRVTDKIRAEFDSDQNWTGYVVKANSEVDLRYTEQGEWIGLIV